MQPPQVNAAEASEANRRKREEHNQKMGPLLKLAAKIRNQIFALALPSDQHFNTAHQQDWFDDSNHEKPTKLIRTPAQYKREFCPTQVCRQIRAEALKVAYAANKTFILSVKHIDIRIKAHRWIESRPSEVLPFITKVVLLRTGRGHGPTPFSLKGPFAIETFQPILQDFEKGTPRVSVELDVTKRYFEFWEGRASHHLGYLVAKYQLTTGPPQEKLLEVVRTVRRVRGLYGHNSVARELALQFMKDGGVGDQWRRKLPRSAALERFADGSALLHVYV